MNGIAMGAAGSMGGDNIQLVEQDSVDVEFSPTTALARYKLNNDGTADIENWGSFDWTNNPGGVGNYEARATYNSGDTPISGDSTGSWLNLATTRQWLWSVTSLTRSTNLTIEIRHATSLVVLASVTVDISAQSI